MNRLPLVEEIHARTSMPIRIDYTLYQVLTKDCTYRITLMAEIVKMKRLKEEFRPVKLFYNLKTFHIWERRQNSQEKRLPFLIVSLSLSLL